MTTDLSNPLEPHAPPHLVSQYEALVDAAAAGDVLDPRVTALGLCFAFGNKGAPDLARAHAELALAAGLTRPEAAEALLAGVLSRGIGVLLSNRWILDKAPDADWPDPVDGALSSDEILAYFSANLGGVPSWLQSLGDFSAPTLEAYYELRAEILRDGAMLRRHKELILVVINSSERYHFGMDVHMRGALTAGASPEEVWAAARTSIVSGGVVAWIEAADRVTAALDGSGAG